MKRIDVASHSTGMSREHNYVGFTCDSENISSLLYILSCSRQILLSILGLTILTPFTAMAQSRTVAITVDDLPLASPASVTPADIQIAEQVNRSFLKAFQHYHIPATGFVIEKQAEDLGLLASIEILRQWTRPGFGLGNHFYSHADMDQISIAEAEQEIVKGETTFAPLLANVSRKPEFLRFPYNHTGDTQEKHDAITAFMKLRGYRLAPCTIDTSDYEFNATYLVALARHDKQMAARIRDAYIVYSGAEIDWYTTLDKQVFGYDPPHVMLLHDSALNAATIKRVVALFKNRGYTFISLNDALKSPAYSIPESITSYGPMWGYRWAKELGIKVNGKDEPDPPAWIEQYRKSSPKSSS